MEALTKAALPPIPAKRYFTIGEVSELCAVKPYVLRYWEQEFTQLKPMKRRGNRRYYQHHEVLLIRRIRDLLYEQGFTIIGARNRLGDAAALVRPSPQDAGLDDETPDDVLLDGKAPTESASRSSAAASLATPAANPAALQPAQLRAELMSIRELLSA